MKLREQYAAARKAAKDIQDKANAEGRAKTPEEQAEFDTQLAEAKRIKPILDAIDADQAELVELTEAIAATPLTGVISAFGEPRQTPGDIVVASDAYKAMRAANPAGGSGNEPVKMSKVSVGSFRNAVTVEETMTAPLYRVAPLSLSQIDIFNAINVIEDAPDAIKIFRFALDNDADIVAPGEPKPESDLTITSDTVNLEVIAHQTPVNNQTLWHNSLLRNRIDVAMINGVRAKAQAEVAQELIDQVALMQTQAFDTDLATTLRKAVTKAQLGAMEMGANPSNISVALSPFDHETLDLELLAAMVALAGQELTQTGRIWRANIVPLFGLPEGTAFVGDLKQVDFYVGTNGVTVTTGWINEQFIKNQVTILAELEAKAAVIGGAALVSTDLGTGS